MEAENSNDNFGQNQSFQIEDQIDGNLAGNLDKDQRYGTPDDTNADLNNEEDREDDDLEQDDYDSDGDSDDNDQEEADLDTDRSSF